MSEPEIEWFEVVKDSADEINQLHEANCTHAKQTIENAIRIGELLSIERAKHKHGEWLPWLKANIKFDQKTAHNYRRIYKHRDKLGNVPNLTEAYRISLPGNSKARNRDVTKPKVLGLFGGIRVKLELSEKEFKLLNRALNPQSAPNEIEKAINTFVLSLRTRCSSIQRFLGTD
jgi:hypothetical protein